MRATYSPGRAVRMACLLVLVALAGLAAIPGVAAAANTPPKITKAPASMTVEEGQPASFSATASGTPTPTQQWEVSTNGGASFTPIEGATSGTYSITATS